MKLEMTMGVAPNPDMQTRQKMTLDQLSDILLQSPDQRTQKLWYDLAAVTVNEHGLMRQDCRCRVCRSWWRR